MDHCCAILLINGTQTKLTNTRYLYLKTFWNSNVELNIQLTVEYVYV